MSTVLDSGAASVGGEDLSAVSWVAGELQRSLDTAHKALRRFLKESQATGPSDVDAPDAAILRQARVQLHQSVGALELVGLPQPAKVLRASEAAVQRIAGKPALLDAAAVEAIESASFAVIDYLNRLLARRAISPVALFPQYRAVQTLAGVDRIHPADLWGAHWRWQPLAAERGVVPRAADDGARGEMETLVLALMRRADAPAMARLSDFCAQLGAGASSPLATTTWQLAAAFFDAQSHGLLDSDVYAKRMASRLLAQLRANVRAADEVSELLASDLLFFCARANAPQPGRAPRLQAVRRAWELGDSAAITDYDTPRLGRFDPSLLAQARKRVVAAKDVWSAVAGGDTRRLPTLAEPFSLLGDSLQRLFPGGDVLSRSLQAAAGQAMLAGAAPPAGLAMEMATAVLWIDAALEEAALDSPELAERVRQIAGRIDQARDGGDVQPLEPWIEELYRRVSDQQTMGSVVHELRASLTEIEKSIDQYFRNTKQRDVLMPVPAQLQAMRGVLSVLDLQQASAAVIHMQRQIDELASTEVDPAQALQTGTFDRLADNLGTLGFLIDMLSVQPTLARSLFHFDAEQGRLIAETGGAPQPSGFGGLGPPSPVALMPQDIPPTMALVPELLVDKAQTLAEAAVAPHVSDEDLAHRLAVLGERATADDETGLARVAAQARATLEGAAGEAQKQAARAELAQAVQQWAAPAAPPAIPQPAPVPPRPELDKPAAPGTTGLEDDDEMRGIFLEEAREVIGNSRAALQALAANSEDVAEMTTVRRGFHTLKGSSRMVGLREFGEAAWGCEQLYNARLASDPRVDLGLADFTRIAFDELAEWIEDIEQRRDAARSARGLVARADALRLGRPVEPVAAPPPAAAEPEMPTISLAPVTAGAAAYVVRDIARAGAAAGRHEEPTKTLKLPALADRAGDRAEPAQVAEDVDEKSLAALEGQTVFEALLLDSPEPSRLPHDAAEVTQIIEPGEATQVLGPVTAEPAPEPAAEPIGFDDVPPTLVLEPDTEPEPIPPTLRVEPPPPPPPPPPRLALRVPDLPSAADLELTLPASPAPPPPTIAPDWHAAPTVEMNVRDFMFAASPPPPPAPPSPPPATIAPNWQSAPTVEMNVLGLMDAKAPRRPDGQLPEVVEVIDATAGVEPLKLPEVTEELPEPLPLPAAQEEVPLTLNLSADAPALLPEIDLAALDERPGAEALPVERTQPLRPDEQPLQRFEHTEVLSGPAAGVAATQALFGPADDMPLHDLELDLAVPTPDPLDAAGIEQPSASPDDGPDTLELPIEATQILGAGELVRPQAARAGDAAQADEAAEAATLQSLPAALPAALPDPGSLGDLTLDLGALPTEPVGEPLAQPPAELPIEFPAEPPGEAFADSANDALAAPEDEGLKVIGPLRISIPLFNIFLNEADEQSRRLVTALAEWALEWHHAAAPESSEALAHSLAGNSATVGYADLSALARALEHAITRSRRAPRGRDGESVLFSDASEEIRRLLHQFAAGFLRPAPAALMARLADHERWPALEMAEPGETSESLEFEADEPPLQALFEPPLVERPEVDNLPDLSDAAAAPAQAIAGIELAPAQASGSDESDDGDDIDAVDEIDAELLPIFTEEAEELLPQLQERVSEWLAHPDNRAAADGVMRNLHTFKGGARLAGAMRVGEMAHRLETDVERLLAAEAIGVHDLDTLQAQVDRIVHSFEALHRAPAAGTLPVAPVVPVAPVAPDAPIAPVAPVALAATPAPVATPPTDAVVADAAPAAEALAVVDAAPLDEHALALAAAASAAAAVASLGALEAEGEAQSIQAAPAVVDESLGETVFEPAAAEAAPATEAPLASDVLPDALPGATQVVDLPLEDALPPQPEPLAPIDWSRFTGATPATSARAAADATAQVVPLAGSGVVRVRSGLLDRLVNSSGEVSIARARIEADVRLLQGSLGELTGSLERMRRELRDLEVQAESQISARIEAAKAAAQAFDPLEMDRFTRLQELTRMMAESVNDVATLQRSLQRTLQSTEDQLAAQARQTRELQEDLLSTRMTEFESLADRLYRVVRQAAREAARQVRLEIVGGAIEVDRGVLERMAGPFEHLLRNSVVHGIEPPEQRAAAGKDRSGTITITVAQAGNEVVVEFADDGAGLNLPRIRERAVERGLLAADAQTSDDELAQLIFVAGFSTAGAVTELAGRGVGMDVVRAEIAGMGGRIETHTETGRGARFRLVLPLTTAVTQVVMLRCGGMHLAVPSTLVEIVRRVPTTEVSAAYDSGHLMHAGESVPFFWLAALVEGGAPLELTGRTQAVVIVRSAAQRVALHLDEVEGNQEVVVKNLGPQLARMPALAGVTLLPSGEVALIYNPVALAALYGESARARQHRAVVPAPVAGQPVIAVAEPAAQLAPLVMVVDDSLTVRRVTQRLLEREGYRVVLAKDGIDALERLAGERPRVMLCDIEMPRMDGFELVRSLRADPERRGIPVIMITSRIAQKHRDHAASLGVEHYLGKPFAEDALLALVAHYCAAVAA